jgi:hypothetical protein
VSDDAAAWIGVIGSLAGAGVGGWIGAAAQKGSRKEQRRRDTNERVASMLTLADRARDKFDEWRSYRRPDQHATPDEQAKAVAHLDGLRELARDTRHHAQYLALASEPEVSGAAESLASVIANLPSHTHDIWATADGQDKEARSDAQRHSLNRARHALLQAAKV